MRKKPDPIIKTQPWKVLAVYSPIEQIIDRLEIDGTVLTAGRQIIFSDASCNEVHDAIESLMGIIDFHKIANDRFEVKADYAAIEKLANKLEAGMVIFDTDLHAIRAAINSCKRQMLSMRVSQAESLVRDVQLGIEFDKIKRRAA